MLWMGSRPEDDAEMEDGDHYNYIVTMGKSCESLHSRSLLAQGRDSQEIHRITVRRPNVSDENHLLQYSADSRTYVQIRDSDQPNIKTSSRKRAKG